MKSVHTHIIPKKLQKFVLYKWAQDHEYATYLFIAQYHRFTAGAV